ncbi:hypothetical protein B0H11DRAFT_1909047 [Mycena galericulata]|nr:hypothetical protein B0H11DRAFT_1909047 [Mycena galericulata]
MASRQVRDPLQSMNNNNNQFGRDNGLGGGDYNNNTGSNSFEYPGCPPRRHLAQRRLQRELFVVRISRTHASTGGYGGGSATQGNDFNSDNRTTSGGNTIGNQTTMSRVSGAEKLAGKLTGNPGMRERGEERKVALNSFIQMGEFDKDNF